jgi:hypothetical protein
MPRLFAIPRLFRSGREHCQALCLSWLPDRERHRSPLSAQLARWAQQIRSSPRVQAWASTRAERLPPAEVSPQEPASPPAIRESASQPVVALRLVEPACWSARAEAVVAGLPSAQVSLLAAAMVSRSRSLFWSRCWSVWGCWLRLGRSFPSRPASRSAWQQRRRRSSASLTRHQRRPVRPFRCLRRHLRRTTTPATRRTIAGARSRP